MEIFLHYPSLSQRCNIWNRRRCTLSLAALFSFWRHMASIENRVLFLHVINWNYVEYPISFSFKLPLIPIFLYAQQEGYFILSLNPLLAQVLLPFNLRTCQGKEQDDSPLLELPRRWWICKRKFYSKLFPISKLFGHFRCNLFCFVAIQLAYYLAVFSTLPSQVH